MRIKKCFSIVVVAGSAGNCYGMSVHGREFLRAVSV
jgi:hypothetical protein